MFLRWTIAHVKDNGCSLFIGIYTTSQSLSLKISQLKKKDKICCRGTRAIDIIANGHCYRSDGYILMIFGDQYINYYYILPKQSFRIGFKINLQFYPIFLFWKEPYLWMMIVIEIAVSTQMVIRWYSRQKTILSQTTVDITQYNETTYNIQNAITQNHQLEQQIAKNVNMQSPHQIQAITLQNPTKILHPTNQQIERKCLDINNLYEKLLTFSYEKELGDFEADISNLFGSLIWAQKKYPELIYQMFEISALENINAKHAKSHVNILFKNYVILLTNLKEQGILASMILDTHILSDLIEMFVKNSKEDQQEIIEYVGSYLKMYQRIFSPNWIQKFIDKENQCFQLLQMAFKFYNCPQPITRTSIFNNIFALLNYKEVREYLGTCQQRRPFYLYIIDGLTKQFKQELAEYCLRLSHTSKNDDVQYILNELEDKIMFWDDVSKSVSGCQNIFQEGMVNNVMLPLLVGPLRYQQCPIFTLKFSLLVVKKLVPIFSKFGLMQKFLEYTFMADKVQFNSETLFKSVLQPFQINKICSKQLEFMQPQQEMKQQSLEDINLKNFYINIFRSKDSHFIIMSTTLLITILQQIHQNKSSIKLQGNVSIMYMLTQILITQLEQQHNLHTIIFLIDTLTYINKKNPIDSVLQNQYLYIFKHLIQDIQKVIHKEEYQKYLQDLIHTIQSDIKIVEQVKFGQHFIKNNKKIMENYKIVFTWDLAKEQQLQNKFYTGIPDTNVQHARYLYIKFMILRRGYIQLSDQIPENQDKILPNLKQLYYQKNLSHSPYIPGDIYQRHHLKTNAFDGQIYDNKNKIPVLILEDDQFFVTGFFDKRDNSVTIMTSIKFKYISCKANWKKDKICVQIDVCAFNKETQRIQKKMPMVIRNCHKAFPFLTALCQQSKQRELTFIKNLLKSTKDRLPQNISLI